VGNSRETIDVSEVTSFSVVQRQQANTDDRRKLPFRWLRVSWKNPVHPQTPKNGLRLLRGVAYFGKRMVKARVIWGQAKLAFAVGLGGVRFRPLNHSQGIFITGQRVIVFIKKVYVLNYYKFLLCGALPAFVLQLASVGRGFRLGF
jgi:hypothetical protein